MKRVLEGFIYHLCCHYASGSAGLIPVADNRVLGVSTESKSCWLVPFDGLILL